jgi:glycosyltransferase involved in cell wall biosynthesis
MINITVFLSLSPSEGGKYQYCLSILDALSIFEKKKYRITAVYFDSDWIRHIPKWFESRKIIQKGLVSRLIFKGVRMLWNGLEIYRAYGKYLNPIYSQLATTSPDIILYPGNEALLYEIAIPGIIPVFDLMHRYEKFPEIADTVIFRKRELHYKRVCRYAQAILVDSEVGKMQLLESYEVDEKKVFELSYVAPSYVTREWDINIAERYCLPEKFIFYPAQFWEHKNHIRLLEAIHILAAEKNLIVNVVLVGSAKNADDQIMEYIQIKNLSSQVFMLSYVSNEELVALYKIAVALIMPSLLGPTNIPQLEAFALKCPVLTSSVYGVPDQVGDAALLFNPLDSRDIADKIEMVCLDETLRERLIKAGVKQNERHSLSNFRNNLEKAIQSVL